MCSIRRGGVMSGPLRVQSGAVYALPEQFLGAFQVEFIDLGGGEREHHVHGCGSYSVAVIVNDVQDTVAPDEIDVESRFRSHPDVPTDPIATTVELSDFSTTK